MKKKLLMVLFPVVLVVAGALAVWGNEQTPVQPGCNNCAKMTQQAPCPNCPKGAAIEKGTAAPCPNCPKAAAAEKGAAPCANCPNAANAAHCANCPNAANAAPCANCPNSPNAPKPGADAKPAGCDKCAKLQQPDQQPAAQQAAQPAPKGCCNKQKAL